MNNLIQIVRDRSVPLQDRIDAATTLWSEIIAAKNAIDHFKAHLIKMGGLTYETPTCEASVEPLNHVPNFEHLSTMQIINALGEDNFNKYISSSHSLRWSTFKAAPDDVKEMVFKIAPPRSKKPCKVTFKHKS